MSQVVFGEIGKKLDEYLTRLTPFGFSGALLAARGEQILLNKGYGMAIRAQQIQNSTDTVFNLGSITKQFTAAAIMKLEMMGLLDTAVSLSHIFPHVPDDKANITLHHLLTHTAGLLNYTGPDYEMADREETVLKILTAPLEFEPGSRHQYSNAGYTLLAALIEFVAKQPYEQFLQTHLFTLAGMDATGYMLPNWQEYIVAHWYVGETDYGAPPDKPYPSWNLLGNGDMLSTTIDMFRWHRALLGDEILSAAAKEKLYTPFLQDYAYGWVIEETPYGRSIAHDGGSEYGSSAELRRYVDADVVTMLYCNQHAGGQILKRLIRDHIQSLTFGGEVTLPPETEPISLTNFVGPYTVGQNGRLTLTIEDDRLLATPENQAGINWLHFDDAAETAVFPTLLQNVTKMMGAALKGDEASFLSSLARRKAREPGVMALWQRIIGSVEANSVQGLGIRPSQFMADALDILLVVTGKLGETTCLVIWRDGQNVGLAPMEMSVSFALPFQPVSDEMLTGYDLLLARNIMLPTSFRD